MYLFNPSDFTAYVAGLPGPGNPFIRTYRTENSGRMFVSTTQFQPQMRMVGCSIHLIFAHVSVISKLAKGTFPIPVSFIDFNDSAKIKPSWHLIKVFFQWEESRQKNAHFCITNRRVRTGASRFFKTSII